MDTTSTAAPVKSARKITNRVVSLKNIDFIPETMELVFFTAPTADNTTGRYKLNAASSARLAIKTIGQANLFALIKFVKATNGATKLSMDIEHCVEGEAWTRVDKKGVVLETGVYTKTWDKTSNFALDLGFVVEMKIAEISYDKGFVASSPIPAHNVNNATAQYNEGFNDQPVGEQSAEKQLAQDAKQASKQ